MPGKHTASFYVQFTPSYSKYANERKVTGLRATNLTQKVPKKPDAGSVVAKLNVTLPDAVFLPMRPEINVEIPEEHVSGVPHAESTPVAVLYGDGHVEWPGENDEAD